LLRTFKPHTIQPSEIGKALQRGDAGHAYRRFLPDRRTARAMRTASPSLPLATLCKFTNSSPIPLRRPTCHSPFLPVAAISAALRFLAATPPRLRRPASHFPLATVGNSMRSHRGTYYCVCSVRLVAFDWDDASSIVALPLATSHFACATNSFLVAATSAALPLPFRAAVAFPGRCEQHRPVFH
jgi:hypothetical protein